MSNSDQESQRLSDRQKNTLRTIAMIVCAAVIIGGILLCAFSIRSEGLRKKMTAFPYAVNEFNEDVFPITMDEQAQKNEVKKVSRHGQTGKFAYYCSSVVRMQSYMAEGAIYFGNVSSNDCALVFTLYDENDVPICRSVGVAPGYYVHSMRLSDPKENGTYACRLYVSAYDLQTNAYLGAQYSDLTLVIGG